MSFPVSQCSVFIQIWVDTNSAKANSTEGIYIVDNRVSSGSSLEGTSSLMTTCTLNSFICWQVFSIDPNFEAMGGNLQIQQIGNSNAWGASGQPQMVNATTFTGQVQNGGEAGYQIVLNMQQPGGSGITLRVNPNINVTTSQVAAALPSKRASITPEINVPQIADSTGYYVRVVSATQSIPNPQTQIAIAIDTAFVASLGGSFVSSGIYMMDNQVNLGSTNEGTSELSTVCNNGSLIGFSVYPIDPNSGDSVSITGFNVSGGNVFGGSGYPLQETPDYWIGQAVNRGSQVYQIQVKITTGGLRPVSYYVNWDPYITSR
ncbi:MAG: hypothetical protein ACK587_13150 [Cyanobacteriota bacterium]